MSKHPLHITPLETKNLGIGYRNKAHSHHVLENINIQVKKGELIAILGKNGSGKTSLLKTLSGFLPPLKGKVLIQDKPLQQFSSLALAQHIAVVLTEPLPHNLLRVGELIRMGRQAHTNWLDTLTPTDKEIIQFAITMTNTEELLHAYYDELSDGQKQKVQIARSLAQDTPLLFLDEPTAHLDIHHRMETFLLLKKLAHIHHKTIIMATHEIGLAVSLADQLWLLHDNTINIGSPQELIAQQHISKVFDSDLIRFNAQTATFEYK